jgi:hypothetical protein
MIVRGRRQTVLLLYLFSFIVATAYFIFVALPVLTGKSGDNAFVGDAALYINFDLHSFISSHIQDILEGRWALGAVFGYIGINFISIVATTVLGENAIYGIFLFNMLLFVGVIRNIERILKHYKVPVYSLWLFLFIFNPFLIASLSSLNKEIVGFYVMSSLLSNSLRKKWGRYAFVALLGLLFRDLYGFVAILYFIALKFRVRFFYILVALSIVAPFCLDFAQLNDPATMGQRSVVLMGWANELTQHPFGYIIAFPLKAAIQLFAPIYSFYLLDFFKEGYIDYYSSAINISSMIFGFMILYIFIRSLLSRVGLPREPIVLFYSYLLLISLSPYSIHRIVTPSIIPLYVTALILFHRSRIRTLSVKYSTKGIYRKAFRIYVFPKFCRMV